MCMCFTVDFHAYLYIKYNVLGTEMAPMHNGPVTSREHLGARLDG